MTESGARVAVVVLGDLGRSPRMLYHAVALAEAGARVDLVGYEETDLAPAVSENPAIRVHALRAPARDVPRALFVAHGLLRVVRQAGELFRVLRRVRADTILVQTPPAIPTLLVALVAARASGARFVVDWHNFGWAMLGLRLPARHPVVRLARAWERLLGPRADAHLCVSHAMAAELARNWRIQAVVLHDRPAERFIPAPPETRAAIRVRLAAEWGISGSLALVVAPTGWTADEDVDLLVDAAVELDAAIATEPAMPDVVIVATGRGPLREAWERRVATLSLRRVRLCARWLPAAEYPGFLAAADVGISVHRSASGLDLPMKVADLLGAGVPVCALAYAPCLAEMIRDGETGLLFTTGEELATRLRTLLGEDRDGDRLLARLRRNVATAEGERWGDAWHRAARPVLLP
ncbi:MAG: glycosyltransferase [Candidatus Binatia bacterium]